MLSFPFDDIQLITSDDAIFDMTFNWYDFSNFVTVATAPIKTLVTLRIIKYTSAINKYFFNNESPFKPGIAFKRFPFLSLNKKYSDSELTVSSIYK